MKKIMVFFVIVTGIGTLYSMQPNESAAAASSEEQCAICLRSFDEIGEENIRVTLCDHQFCRSCLKEWIKQSDTCPLCRADLCSNAWIVIVIRLPKRVNAILDRLGIIVQRVKHIAGNVVLNCSAPTIVAALIAYYYFNPSATDAIVDTI